VSLYKELTGVEFFDARHGGVFAGRPWLLVGPSMSGKSAISLQFLAQGIRMGQRCLLLSAQPAPDVAIWAARFGPDVAKAIETEQLIILEYSHYVPGRDSETNLMLPPEGFLELQEILTSYGIRRAAINTVLPWVLTSNLHLLPEHVFSFVRAFERLRCTTLFTLPRPVSTAAVRVKNALDDVVPISVTLSIVAATGQRYWLTTKYLGETRADEPVPFVLVEGRGAVEELEKPAEPAAAPARAPATTSEATAQVTTSSARSADVAEASPQFRFSRAVFGSASQSSRELRGFRFGFTSG